MSSRPSVILNELESGLDEVKQNIGSAVIAWHTSTETPSSFIRQAQKFLDDSRTVNARGEDLSILKSLIDYEIAPRLEELDLPILTEVNRKLSEYRQVTENRITYRTRRPAPAEPAPRSQPVKSTTSYEPQKRRFMGGLITLAAAIGIAGAGYLMFKTADNSEKDADKPAVIENVLTEESLPEIRYKPKTETAITPVAVPVPKVASTSAVSKATTSEIALQPTHAAVVEQRKIIGYKISESDEMIANRKGLWGIAQIMGTDPVKFGKMYAEHHRLGADTDTMRVVNGVVMRGSDGLRADVVRRDVIVASIFNLEEINKYGIATEKLTPVYEGEKEVLPSVRAYTKHAESRIPAKIETLPAQKPQPQLKEGINGDAKPHFTPAISPRAEPIVLPPRKKLGSYTSQHNEPTKVTSMDIVNPQKNLDMNSGFTYSSQGNNIQNASLENYNYRNKADIQAVAEKTDTSSADIEFNPIYMSRVMRSFTEMCDKTGDVEKAVNYVAMAEDLTTDKVYSIFETTNRRIVNIMQTWSGMDAARTVGMQLGVSASNAQGAYENLSEALLLREESKVPAYRPMAKAA